jgi:hypothetical protein
MRVTWSVTGLDIAVGDVTERRVESFHQIYEKSSLYVKIRVRWPNLANRRVHYRGDMAIVV